MSGRITLSVATAAMMLSGCSQMRPPHRPKPKPPPPAGVDFLCRLQPVIVTQEGQHRWTDAKLAGSLQWLAPVFAQAQLLFEVAEPVEIESPDWFAIAELAAWYQLCQDAERRSKADGVLAVYLVDSVPLYGGAAGVANLPSNSPMISFLQYGCVVAAGTTCETTLAHELSHSFNLEHADVGGPCPQQRDCHLLPCKCSIRSYCCDGRQPVGACAGLSLATGDVAVVRTWASCLPRSECTEALTPAARDLRGRLRIQYRSTSEPVVCLQEPGDGD